jgi:hypothetical protein
MNLVRTTLAFLRFFEAQVIAPAGKQGQTSKVEHAYKQSFSDRVEKRYLSGVVGSERCTAFDAVAEFA